MNKNNLVSVIMPFFNAEKFIEEALESVLAQTYKEWELILVDDGSTDNSTKIALEYRNRFPDKVMYLEHDQHQNKGSSATRNLGIQNAKGKYIATIDSDDVWIKHKLAQQVEILEAIPEAGMVCGNTKYWHTWTQNDRENERDYYMHDNINSSILKLNSLIDPPKLLLHTLNGEFDPVSMSNIMLRKEVIERVGGFEEVFTGMHDDQAFTAKIYLNTPVYVAAACWDMYRQHPGSCYHQAVKRGRLKSSELFYLSWLEKYLYENKISDNQLLSTLHRKKWRYKHPILNKARHTITKNTKKTVRSVASYLLPPSVIHYLVSKIRRNGYRPLLGLVNFGELRRLDPISKSGGQERGLPIEMYYIEKFLKSNSLFIKGRVLEIGSDCYTLKYGNHNISPNDIWNLIAAHKKKSIETELSSASNIPSNTFECIILIQTLQAVYDLHSVLSTLNRILKPGGVLLATMPCISSSADYDSFENQQYWHFTSPVVRKLFEEHFTKENIHVQGFGNVLAAASLLYGLAAEDLKHEELDHFDPNYQVIITMRAVKST